MKQELQRLQQGPDEERILFVRRHWFLFARRTVFFFVLALLPVVAWAYFNQDVTAAVEEQSLAGVLMVMGASLWYLYLLFSFLHAWVDYYLDVWIVSTRRIVNVEQLGFFSRDVSELMLDKIQDVTVQVRGMFPTMLRYGDVIVQTASETPRFLFDDVPDPYKVADTIMELQRKFAETNPSAQVSADPKKQKKEQQP